MGQNLKGPKTIKIGSLNICRGLYKKEELVHNVMLQENLKIFGICETDLIDFDEKKPFCFPGYETLWPEKKPGEKFCRLLLFISKDIPYNRRCDLERNTQV